MVFFFRRLHSTSAPISEVFSVASPFPRRTGRGFWVADSHLTFDFCFLLPIASTLLLFLHELHHSPFF